METVPRGLRATVSVVCGLLWYGSHGAVVHIVKAA